MSVALFAFSWGPTSGVVLLERLGALKASAHGSLLGGRSPGPQFPAMALSIRHHPQTVAARVAYVRVVGDGIVERTVERKEKSTSSSRQPQPQLLPF